MRSIPWAPGPLRTIGAVHACDTQGASPRTHRGVRHDGDPLDHASQLDASCHDTGGYIATKIGGAKVLAAGVALWSVGTLIAPPSAQMGILSLCASRVLVGGIGTPLSLS